MSRYTILTDTASIVLSRARRDSIQARVRAIYGHALAMRDERTRQQPLPFCPLACGCTELGDCPLIGVSPR